MPTVAAAVVALHAWPEVPVGWERHMTSDGNFYPEEDHEEDPDHGHR